MGGRAGEWVGGCPAFLNQILDLRTYKLLLQRSCSLLLACFLSFSHSSTPAHILCVWVVKQTNKQSIGGYDDCADVANADVDDDNDDVGAIAWL